MPTVTGETRVCALCGRATTDPVETTAAVYCSPGCRDAERQLDELADRTAAAQSDPADDRTVTSAAGRPDCTTAAKSDATDGPTTSAPADGMPDSPDASHRRSTAVEQGFFHVAGMHSVTCEEFLESVARKQDGVRDADASYVTETITVTYDSDRTDEDRLEEALSSAGYRALSREKTSGEAAATVLTDPRGESRALEDLLGFRYVAGIVFGTFLLLPYIVVFYPAQYALLPVEPFADGGFGGETFPLLLLLVSVTAVVVLFTGLPLLRGAYVSVRTGRPNTDLLAMFTVLGAFVYSTVALLAGRIDIYFDLAIVVTAAVVAAVYYESLVKRRALGRLTDLTVARTEEARVIRSGDGDTETVDAETLQPGERVLVREGERIPVDGTLAAGRCTVDESVVTGESRPVTREAGESVVGGSVVTGDGAVIEVRDPPASSIDRLTTAVWLLQSATHGLQRRTDRIAAAVVPGLALLAVLVTVAVLGLGRGPIVAVLAGLAVLLVACPWGLALATPLSVATTLRDALERGIVVSDETVFERLRETDTVVFDKTGTLTTGELRVVAADAPRETLSAAALLERRAGHPAAAAIVEAFEYGDQAGDETDSVARPDGGDREAAPQRGRVTRFESHAWGVEGAVDGTPYLVGHPELFANRGWAIEDSLVDRIDEARAAGRLPVVVGCEGEANGLIELADERREGWQSVARELAESDIEVVVLTGDDPAAATPFRECSAVEAAFAGVPPAGKTAVVKRLQQGAHVTMVGDGTNDAPALAQADLGIALGSGTALASDAADVALVGDDLGTVSTTFELARAADRRVATNTALALSYNAVTVPAALLGLLTPLVAMAGVVLTGGLLAANSTRSLLSR